jgi:hypothetical protein
VARALVRLTKGDVGREAEAGSACGAWDRRDVSGDVEGACTGCCWGGVGNEEGTIRAGASSEGLNAR